MKQAVPRSPKSVSIGKAIEQLCSHCALCCNGVLFKDVELQSGDDPTKFRTFDLPLTELKSRKSQIAHCKFPQPCAALNGCHCRIYADRPTRCRQFECLLLKSVQSGDLEVVDALRVIQDARKRAERVRSLLRELGDVQETLALSLRFKRTRRRFEASPPDDYAQIETFSELTLAVHHLNLLLRAKFYP